MSKEACLCCRIRGGREGWGDRMGSFRVLRRCVCKEVLRATNKRKTIASIYIYIYINRELWCIRVIVLW